VLYGLDISDFSSFQNDWFKFFRANCGKRDELERVVDSGIKFDVTVDDGSHASFHQQLTLVTLLPALKPGGIFIIEDLQWQPTTYEAILPKVPRTSDLLFDMAGSGKTEVLGTDLDDQIASVMLYTEDELVRQRKRFNDIAGVKPTAPHFADGSSTGTAALRSKGRRIAEGLQGPIPPDQAGGYPEGLGALLTRLTVGELPDNIDYAQGDGAGHSRAARGDGGGE
jgi:hypothetical protein